MADLTHISTDDTLPDGAYVANGTGDGNVKSLQSMTETSVRQSLRAGVDDSFGFAKDGLFGILLRSLGGILGGAVELGVGALSWVVDGVVGLIDGVARAIANIFPGSGGGQVDPPPPPPPIFNPIKTNLEAVLEPKFTEVDQLLEESASIRDALNGVNQEKYHLLDQLSELNETFPQKVEETLEQSEKIQGLTEQLGEKVDSQSRLITDLTDLSTNFSEKVSETGSVSGLQESYRTLNTRLWGEQGEVNEDNEQQWGEQGILNSLQAEMWSDQGKVNELNELLWEQQDEIDTLQTQRADTHAQMIELNRQNLETQAEFVMRTMFAPGFQGAYDDHFRVTPSGKQWRVEALGAWTGEYTLTSAWMRSGNWEPVLDFETVPRSDPTSPRVRYHNGSEYSTILNYWVRKAINEVHDASVGGFTADTTYSSHPDLNFIAPIDADYDIFFRVVWGAATWDDSYAFRVQRNGETLMKWGPFTKLGPVSFLDSGVRTRTISEIGVPLRAGDQLTFETYSNAGSDSQRRVNSADIKLSWLVPADDPSMATTLSTTGDGGFTPAEDIGQNIEWNWQNSIRFLDHDVTADRTVSVHSYDTGLYTPVSPGTTITSPAYIRTVEPHPDRVTFTRKS